MAEVLREEPFCFESCVWLSHHQGSGSGVLGGRKLDGSGGKITDFLVKNRMTDNVAIVEIKTPQTRLLNKGQYRGGVYVPSAALSGAVNQALDQQHQFEREILTLKGRSEVDNIQSYAVHCCLIVGQIPMNADHKKSFELFRRNSKNVEVITFDELLRKLKDLLGFLGPGRRTQRKWLQKTCHSE